MFFFFNFYFLIFLYFRYSCRGCVLTLSTQRFQCAGFINCYIQSCVQRNGRYTSFQYIIIICSQYKVYLRTRFSDSMKVQLISFMQHKEDNSEIFQNHIHLPSHVFFNFGDENRSIYQTIDLRLC